MTYRGSVFKSNQLPIGPEDIRKELRTEPARVESVEMVIVRCKILSGLTVPINFSKQYFKCNLNLSMVLLVHDA